MTDFEDVENWLQGKYEELDPGEDAEAINCYRMAEEYIQYGKQAEYLQQD